MFADRLLTPPTLYLSSPGGTHCPCSPIVQDLAFLLKDTTLPLVRSIGPTIFSTFVIFLIPSDVKMLTAGRCIGSYRLT